MKYIYRFRPSYGSEQYLIEIVNAEQFDGSVLHIFLDAIKEVSPTTSPANLSLFLATDDYEIQFVTSVGNFTFF